jgi:hypothetical protein
MGLFKKLFKVYVNIRHPCNFGATLLTNTVTRLVTKILRK